MVIEDGIDSSYPERHIVVWERLAERIYSLLAGDNRDEVYLLGGTLSQERTIGELHRASRSEHRVNEQ